MPATPPARRWDPSQLWAVTIPGQAPEVCAAVARDLGAKQSRQPPSRARPPCSLPRWLLCLGTQVQLRGRKGRSGPSVWDSGLDLRPSRPSEHSWWLEAGSQATSQPGALKGPQGETETSSPPPGRTSNLVVDAYPKCQVTPTLSPEKRTGLDQPQMVPHGRWSGWLSPGGPLPTLSPGLPWYRAGCPDTISGP